MLSTGVMACLLGGIVVLTLGLSTTWLVLLFLAGVTCIVVVWSGEIANTLLYGLVLTAPIAITKAISARGGVYAPGLELSLVDVFLGCLLVVWLVDLVMSQKPVRTPPPGAGVVLAIFGWAWVSGLFAEDQVAGVLAAINQTKFLLEFIVLYNVVTTMRVLRRVLIAAGLGLALNLVMMTAQIAAGSPLAMQGAKASNSGIELVYAAAEGVRAFRPSAFLLHPNSFADYLVIVLPVPIVLVLLGHRRVGFGWWAASLILAAAGILGLILTMSRGGWISFAAAMLFTVTVGLQRQLLPARRVVGAVALGCVALVLVVAEYPAVIYRITMDDDRSTETRLVMMDQAALIIRDNALLGVGLANYTRASHRYTPKSFAPLPQSYQDTIRAGVVHNGYLLLWAERGIIGLLLHLSVFATALFNFLRIRHWWDQHLHAVALGLLAGVVGQGTFYLFDHFYLDLRPGVFWLLLGLVASVMNIHAYQARLLTAGIEDRKSAAGRAASCGLAA